MDSNIKSELTKDFAKTLSKIDFSSYNPKSSDFENALFIGLMNMVIENMDGNKEAFEISEGNDEISEEIFGAKKYFQRYLDSKDENFRKMSEDELSHASYLIKKAYNKPIGNEEKIKLKKYESDIEQVSNQIKSY